MTEIEIIDEKISSGSLKLPDTLPAKYEALLERNGKAMNMIKTFYRLLDSNQDNTVGIGSTSTTSILKAMDNFFKEVKTVSPKDEM